jgi:hypothetical protein
MVDCLLEACPQARPKFQKERFKKDISFLLNQDVIA